MQETESKLNHWLHHPSTLFRGIVLIGVLATIFATYAGVGALNPGPTLGMGAAVLYFVVSLSILKIFAYDDHGFATALRLIALGDAFLLGVFIAMINFNFLPLIMFFMVIQCDALRAGGREKWFEHNIAFAAGILVVVALGHPTWQVDLQQPVNLVGLGAFVLYFSLYALLTFKDANGLRRRVVDLEKLQVQLKLRNYKLSKYLSPTLRQAIQSGRDVKLETQRKKLAIFFSDIKGFSELAEEMDADALTALLNSYLTEMSEIALQYGGTIDKFIGDAIMVFFGDPTSKGPKLDSVACVSMAIAMKKRMKELQLRWLNQGIQKPLEIRMGINVGYCTVGNFGTENRLDYTLLGTEVNLTSRLESAAEAGEILISHETYMLVKDVIMCRDRGEITVKGFQHPVKVYSVVDLRKNMGKDQNYFEHSTEGFSIYMDLDKIRNYDKDKVLHALEHAHEHLKQKTII